MPVVSGAAAGVSLGKFVSAAAAAGRDRPTDGLLTTLTEFPKRTHGLLDVLSVCMLYLRYVGWIHGS